MPPVVVVQKRNTDWHALLAARPEASELVPRQRKRQAWGTGAASPCGRAGALASLAVLRLSVVSARIMLHVSVVRMPRRCIV